MRMGRREGAPMEGACQCGWIEGPKQVDGCGIIALLNIIIITGFPTPFSILLPSA
jgi:hypothetical protein